jgi:phosphate transport system permease protein
MISSRANILFRSAPSLTTDAALKWLLLSIAGISGAISIFIVFFLIRESFPALSQIGLVRFLTDSSWNPTESIYQMTPIIFGSLATTFGAILIALPIGIISSIFTHYYAPRKIVPTYRRMIEVLAGIPSVVYGFWGLMVLVPLINEIEPPGASLLSAILVLAIMILPTIALMADAAFAMVPGELLSAANALGLNQLGILRIAVIPAARSGLFTGAILQTGRALGETMAVLMVCGNIVQIPSSIFEPVRTLTANIALEMAYAVGTHRSALFASGLLLFCISSVLVLCAEVISRRQNIHA